MTPILLEKENTERREAASQNGRVFQFDSLKMQNFFSNVMPGGGSGGGAEQGGAPWYMKYAAKGAGIGGGVGKDSVHIFGVASRTSLCSGRVLRILVLHQFFATLHRRRDLADLRWSLCHYPGGPVLLHVP